MCCSILVYVWEGISIMSVPAPQVELSVPEASPIPQQINRLRNFWHLLTMSRKVSIGLYILIFFVLVAVLGPVILTQDPMATSSTAMALSSAAHWFGTTQTGQDVFLQTVVGARDSVFMGFGVGIISTIISVIFGLAAGYYMGWIDEVLSLFTNVFLVLPTLPLTILLAAFSPYKGSLVIAFVLIVTGWSWGARVLRSQTLSLRNRDFVEAARASGESPLRIIFFEILPNETAIVAAQLLGTIIYAILAEAGLQFLGIGDVTTASWGSMLYWAANNDALLLGAWWWFVPPGLCIAILGAGLAFVNFGIDEMADPRLRAERNSVRKLLGLAKREPRQKLAATASSVDKI